MEHPFPFTSLNYKLMLGGIFVLLIGMILIGMDSEAHGFGFLGLTLGPIVVFIGFLTQIIAIMIREKK